MLSEHCKNTALCLPFMISLHAGFFLVNSSQTIINVLRDTRFWTWLSKRCW